MFKNGNEDDLNQRITGLTRADVSFEAPSSLSFDLKL
jgi:hypothetical protein